MNYLYFLSQDLLSLSQPLSLFAQSVQLCLLYEVLIKMEEFMKYLYFIVGIIAAVVTFIILFAIDTAVS